jgi:hypothetical protein
MYSGANSDRYILWSDALFQNQLKAVSKAGFCTAISCGQPFKNSLSGIITTDKIHYVLISYSFEA